MSIKKESAKEKKARFEKINAYLEQKYPDAACSLEYKNDPWKLLVMARLSAQCTDARVNIVSEELFRFFPDVYAFEKADIPDKADADRFPGLPHGSMTLHSLQHGQI